MVNTKYTEMTREDWLREISAEEMRELELRYNGPIPTQALEDVVATRPVRDAAYLQIKISDLLQSIKWHRAELAALVSDEWAQNYHTANIDKKHREIDALRKEMEGLK